MNASTSLASNVFILVSLMIVCIISYQILYILAPFFTSPAVDPSPICTNTSKVIDDMETMWMECPARFKAVIMGKPDPWIKEQPCR